MVNLKAGGHLIKGPAPYPRPLGMSTPTPTPESPGKPQQKEPPGKTLQNIRTKAKKKTNNNKRKIRPKRPRVTSIALL